MRTVLVISVRVDDHERLRVKPQVPHGVSSYSMIYREAAWIRWDSDSNERYVAPEKSEPLNDQFTRISRVLLSECDDRLAVFPTTDFSNTPKDVISRICKTAS